MDGTASSPGDDSQHLVWFGVLADEVSGEINAK